MANQLSYSVNARALFLFNPGGNECNQSQILADRFENLLKTLNFDYYSVKLKTAFSMEIRALNTLSFPKGKHPRCDMTGAPATVQCVTPHVTLYYATRETAEQVAAFLIRYNAVKFKNVIVGMARYHA